MAFSGELWYNLGMKILAIESSCDETAAAVIEGVGVFSDVERGKGFSDWEAGVKILSNVVVSQVDIFAEYGGVIPEVAARSHLEAILPVVHQAMREAGVEKGEIDAIAVTHTPGLLGSLLIGTLTARMLAILWGKPLYAVHHLKSHIYANWIKDETAGATVFTQHRCASPHLKIRTRRSLSSQATMLHKNIAPAVSSLSSQHKDSSGASCNDETVGVGVTDEWREPEFPLVALVVSGGHTQIIYMEGHNQFEIIGTTRDDAVGECFDKVAKILGLPYPGGPSIAKCALGQPYTSSSEAVTLSSSKESDPRQPENPLQMKYKSAQYPLGNSRTYRLPKPRVEGLDFSFSGLKTAVLRAVQAELGVPISTPSHELAGKLSERQKADFAAVFQETATDILIEKVKMALKAHPEARSVVIAGGVSANKVLREKALKRLEMASDGRIMVFFPELKYAGDNAAMVGVASYYEIISGVKETDPYSLNIMPRSVIQ